MNNASQKRQDAIYNLVAKWVHQDGMDLGGLKHFGSFNELGEDVSKLLPLGRSPKWEKGINEWLGVIAKAVETFMTENEFDLKTSNEGIAYNFGPLTRHEHTRLLIWAVNQGSIYAAYAA